MPVIECSCGMVMSMPVRGPRSTCIRCGGVEFHLLQPMERARRNSTDADRERDQPLFDPFELVSVELAMAVGSVAVV